MKKFNKTFQEVYSSWNEEVIKISEPNEFNKNLGFRKPQISAIYSALSYISSYHNGEATVVMPTGTGKTDAIFALIIAAKFHRTLILVPSDALRNQTYERLFNLEKLRSINSINENILSPNIFVINSKINCDALEKIKESNVVISTPQALLKNSPEEISAFTDFFTHLVIDEAHHAPAASWQRIKKSFSNKIVLNFTATPFREDKRPIEGEIIYNYSLKNAVRDGYFQKIEFHPVREYRESRVDEVIADKAVFLLLKDIKEGKNHILIARARTKSKAIEIFEHYKKYEELNPILIHSGVKGARNIISDIKKLNHKIIVCVNMLGEGFDLPQLKIAALHDQHCSPAITLQFIGRLTRVDNSLGAAKFIANIADQSVNNQMADLYCEDSDWTSVIQEISQEKISEKIEKDRFIQEFEDSDFYQDVFSLDPHPNISAIAYYANDDQWNPGNIRRLNSNHESLFAHSISADGNFLIVVTKSLKRASWAKSEKIKNVEWLLYLAYYAKKEKIIFLSCSGSEQNLSNFKKIVARKSIKIGGEKVFRIMHGINLLKFQNVGLLRGRKELRFTMHVGRDINSIMGQLEDGQAIKSNIFGIGFRDGLRATAGCSNRGKMWEMNSDAIMKWRAWCDLALVKITDNTINTNEILKNVVRAEQLINEWPDGIFYCDWPECLYIRNEQKTYINYKGKSSSLSNITIEFYEKTNPKNLKVLVRATDDQGGVIFNFFIKIILLGDGVKFDCDGAVISLGQDVELSDYLESNNLIFLRVDGSQIIGNYRYYSDKSLNIEMPIDKLISWEWSGVNINKESMGRENDCNTVQGFTYKKIIDKYDVLFNDDGAGEVADLIGIKSNDKIIYVDFYHCKYCQSGKVPGSRVEDSYVVSGQASRSVKWLHAGDSIFSRLIRRYSNSLEKNFNRILKGKIEDLEILRKKTIHLELKMGFYIVQPAISKSKVTSEILTVLGSSYMYLKNISGTELSVITSP